MRDFRLLKTAFLPLAAATLSLALVGCGESSEPTAAAHSDAEPLGLTSGENNHAAEIDHARQQAHEATKAAGNMDPLADLPHATAEETLQSYITACAAGEFIRAAEFCHPDSPGTKKLISTGEGFQRASEDPATAGMDLRGFLTQGFDQATFTVLEQSDDRWAFEVSIPTKTPTRIEVAKLPDIGWRVLPPEETGLPTQ